MCAESFLIQAQTFLEALRKQLHEGRIQFKPHWSIDHLCYRAETETSYLQNKKDFLQFADLLAESPVNGRLISTFKLHKPLLFLDRWIDLVELPAPKKGRSIAEGFEHIEIVCDEGFSDLKNTYSHLNCDESGIKKDFNAELEFQLNNAAIKFHHYSLQSVINLEKNALVFSALQSSDVLSLCRHYQPLVVGTFPLAISLDSSDLDILLYAVDIEAAIADLTQKFQTFKFFKVHRHSSLKSNLTQQSGVADVISQSNPQKVTITFTHADIPFELYIENLPTTKQKAFLHFQVEEKLLKLGGKSFFEKVNLLRQKGLKTEPAFAQALFLEGEAYNEMLKLHSLSELQLQDKFFKLK